MNPPTDTDFGKALTQARALAAKGDDESAKQAYTDILGADPTHLAALNELGALAYAGGFRSAARNAYLQAVEHHPKAILARVNLANLLREEREPAEARRHYEAALAVDPACHQAHQGMASVLNELGLEGAEAHYHQGYEGHALARIPYRGAGTGVPLLVLMSARGGGLPAQWWISDRQFAATTLYTEFWDPRSALPPHELIVNAIGDAELCDLALTRALDIAERSPAPVINSPSQVRLTARQENARRLGGIAGLVAPSEDELAAVQYLDARGPDGLARRYRVLFVDGAAYPLHLAISPDWRVPYSPAAIADDVYYRDEERRFLEDMAGVLGTLAMSALEQVSGVLGLDCAGIDFALSPAGSVLLFEANAAVATLPPAPGLTWDYRHKAAQNVVDAASAMLLRRAGRS